MYILLFFQHIRMPFLTALAHIISFLGEEPIPVLFTIFLYICISKKKGIGFVGSIFMAIDSMQVVKCIARSPRPFVIYPNKIKPLRVSTATGYSFPSGHSTTASVFYGLIAKTYKNIAARIIAISLIVLVPLSRLYLGVHWPSDVIFGTILGLTIAFSFSSFFERLYEEKEKFTIFTLTAASVFTLAFLIFSYILDFRAGTEILWKDIMESFALSSGALFGLALERNFINFEIYGSWKVRALNFFLALIGGLVLFALVRLLLPLIYLGKALSIFALCFWVTALYPMIGKKLKLFL